MIKTGRTHLQDATPIRLGQEFQRLCGAGRARRSRLRHAQEELREVPLGGTAVGTGINTHPDFARRVCESCARWTGRPSARRQPLPGPDDHRRVGRGERGLRTWPSAS
ncbi:MAG: hypothetical protein KatS3mg060_0980 [Dehalococcoidia bacterium]|nr:MAG: hypothetical protein KatS3mg060_0980 [Dehalococcoidia bacterium]